MHELWRAKVILSKMPQHLRESLPQKLAAFEVFNKKRQEWGYSRSWKGDYLSLVIHRNFITLKYLARRKRANNRHDHISLFDRRLKTCASIFDGSFLIFYPKIQPVTIGICHVNVGFSFNKSALRVLLVTDSFVAKLDAKKFKLLKDPAPISSVRSLLCS